MSESTTPALDIDLFSPQVIANPQPVYKELRDKYPVYYSRDYDTYFFARFADVWEVLRIGENALLATESNLPTPEYLRTRRNNGAPPFASVNPMAPGPRLASPWYEEMRLAHTAPLRPKSVAALKDFVRELARERLALLLPRRKFNLTMDYAGIVGVTVICSLFGLPSSRAEDLMNKINEITRYSPEKKSIDLATFFTELTQDIVPAILSRRTAGADGTNGLIDGLINYRMEPDQRALSDQEIADQLVCAMVGASNPCPRSRLRASWNYGGGRNNSGQSAPISTRTCLWPFKKCCATAHRLSTRFGPLTRTSRSRASMSKRASASPVCCIPPLATSVSSRIPSRSSGTGRSGEFSPSGLGNTIASASISRSSRSPRWCTSCCRKSIRSSSIWTMPCRMPA